MSERIAEIHELSKGSPDRFGYSWDHYADLLPEHEEQFLRLTSLDKSFWKGVRFLDAGCGIGRNSYWPMTYGALGGLAVDVDDRTLRNARKNLARFPGMEVRVAEDGEVLVRGPLVMAGYYKDPELTMATIDAEGWLATGDKGGSVRLWPYSTLRKL